MVNEHDDWKAMLDTENLDNTGVLEDQSAKGTIKYRLRNLRQISCLRQQHVPSTLALLQVTLCQHEPPVSLWTSNL
ncbi:hypothetical protein VN97_g6344 [Penicillium thymicola]|uniref:Uncharacterized protein n=1 Tax=Penicillium thymicola TaxID=293382 RepID=A0AAI9TGV8_PENTH|nr:hypothetical protein VN97_g6344 [Penicillium thymicola]